MDRIKLAMSPHPDESKGKEHSGIAQVVLNWARYLPEFGIDIAPKNDPDRADVSVGHSASNPNADIHFSHGLLWTEDMPELGGNAREVNATLIQSAKNARRVIVPSNWVADVYRRDMRISPHVIWHGVNQAEWVHDYENQGYVLYTKNRTTDGLDPGQINDVAKLLPHITFYTTFATRESPPNVITYGGTVPWTEMKRHIQKAGVVFMPDRETWGIAAAEALAAGTPVASTSAGAVKEFVEHGQTGYIYRDRNLADAVQAIQYCLKNRDVLGANGVLMAQSLNWVHSINKAANVIRDVYDEVAENRRLFAMDDLFTVAVVITSHNYGHVVGHAIDSALAQTYRGVKEVIVVDDNSDDDTKEVVEGYEDTRVKYRRVESRNVAHARNDGIYSTDCKFVVILDGDDQLRKDFVKDCIQPMLQDRSIGFAYTSTEVVLEDTGEILMPGSLAEETGKRAHKPWPTEEFDKQFVPGMNNQFPACAIFKVSSLKKLGGYSPRYARGREGPEGAGTEDANLYLRLLAHGIRGKMVKPTVNNLWVHTHGSGHVSGENEYKEVDWRAWHPYTRDFRFPFAALATPKNLSHSVRSYEPEVSAIIPVGPGHEQSLRITLDSLEAQNFRKWEAVVVWDCEPDEEIFSFYKNAYPHVRFGETPRLGPGAARNRGVQIAQADFITFLDADDYYSPEFFDHVNKETWRKYQSVLYSQYYSRMDREMHGVIGGTIIKDEGEDVVVNESFRPFSSDRALKRPEGERPYVWTGVNIFMPKMWHNEIGGFDESMRTWEDCLYMLQLAWHGFRFRMVKKPLWVYRFKHGSRREDSSGYEQELMTYIQDKYDESQIGVTEEEWYENAV